jgi:hypothetical protein
MKKTATSIGATSNSVSLNDDRNLYGTRRYETIVSVQLINNWRSSGLGYALRDCDRIIGLSSNG